MPDDLTQGQQAVAKLAAALAEAQAQVDFTTALKAVEQNPDDIPVIRAAVESAERAGDRNTANRLKARWLEVLLRQHR